MSDPGAPPPPPPPDDSWRPLPPPPAPAPPLGYAQQPPYGQQPPAYGQAYGHFGNYGQPGYPTLPQTESSAIVALVLSIVAWMVCPVVLAIVALALIPGARKKIEESHGRLTGEGFLTAAKWVSWINIAVYGLVIIGVALLIMISAVADNSSTYDYSLGDATTASTS